MFTGIVSETGTIRTVDRTPDGRRLVIEWPGTAGDLEPGASVSVSGVCLTVEDRDPDGDRFEVFLARETVDRTYLGALESGAAVNLERAMPADGRFDGHIVQGHVDGTATIESIESIGADWWFRFGLPESIARYVVEKGSITVDGISLTVAELEADRFGVTIIPETMRRTTLSEKAVGDPVNLEVDVIAKYVERLLGADPYTDRFRRSTSDESSDQGAGAPPIGDTDATDLE